MRDLRGRRRSAQAGITLVELLVTMIILTIVMTMLVTSWISLSNSYAFTSRDNQARATARDALTRVSSEIRDAQPAIATSTTPFYLGGTSPYVCDANDCVFYSAYNNPLAYSQSGTSGLSRVALTAIWLDTSGTQAQKTLYWQRDTNGNGALDSNDRKIILATNVVNTAASVNKPIFTYNLYSGASGYTTATSLTAANVASLASVQVDIIVDANLSHAPRYIDLMTTVEPRNQGSN